MDARVPSIALLHKEFLGTLRLKRMWALMLLTVLCVFVFIAFQFWSINDRLRYYYANPMGDIAQIMMILLTFGNLAVLCVLTPALAAVSVCVEKQQGNFDLLITTLIRPSGILFAKVAKILGVYFLYIIATLPAFGALYYFVGVEWGQLLLVLLVLTVTAMHLCVAGAYCSVRLYRTIPAIVCSYLLGALVLGVPQVAAVLLWNNAVGYDLHLDLDEGWASILVPYAMISAMDPAIAGDFSLEIFLCYHGAWIALFSFLAIRRLGRPMPSIHVEYRKPIDDQAALDKRRKRFPYYLADPLRRRDMLPDNKNPIVYKEIYSSLLGTSTRRIRVAYVTAIIAFVVSILMMMDWYYADWHEIVAWVLFYQTCMVLLIIPAMTSTIIVKEYELENMDMLRMTLLTDYQILSGKMRSALISLFPTLVAVMLANIPLLLFSLRSMEVALIWVNGIVVLFLCVIFTVLTSILASLFCKRSIAALLLGYGFSAFALFGLAFIVIIGIELLDEIFDLRYTPFDSLLFMSLLFVSPLVCQFANLEMWTGAFDLRSSSSTINDIWLATVAYSLFVCLCLLFAATLLFKYKLKRDSR